MLPESTELHVNKTVDCAVRDAAHIGQTKHSLLAKCHAVARACTRVVIVLQGTAIRTVWILLRRYSRN